ncbi:MAG TPA: trigger factor [Syntrophales bacterium]|nr:trigger factor [Syntrophales bacterium]
MSETMMAVTVEDVSPVKKKMLFNISWLEVKKELDTTYKNIGKKAKIKGFRQGKVPRNILESMYKEHAEDEVVSNLVNRFYLEALKENKINAIAQPDIDQSGIAREENFTFTATVEVEPVIEPKGYDGLELQKEEYEVKDSDVETRLEEIRDMFSTMEEIEVDRGVLEGDFVVIDFEGFVDGRALKEMRAENHLLEIGSGRFLPGFEKQLIGMKRNMTEQIQINLQDDYHAKHLAGKEVMFSVTLKNIKGKKLPQLDESFIKNFDKYESLDDLKKDIRKTLEEENTAKGKTAFKVLIIEKLLAINEFEVPQTFVNRQIAHMFEDAQRRLAVHGIKRDETAERYKEFFDRYKEEAAKIVRTALLLKSISERESISVSDQEIEDKIREIAQLRGQSYDSLKESLESGNMMEDIKNEILNTKVFGFIEGKAGIEIVRK